MPIRIDLDVMLARRKMKSKNLAAAIGISETNLSLLKQGHVWGIRFGTLEAICRVLHCQPGDMLAYEDRKIVVWGMSVSVRLVLCGRGSITKKKNNRKNIE